MSAGKYSYLKLDDPNVSIVWLLLNSSNSYSVYGWDAILATTTSGRNRIGSKSAYSKVKYYYGLLSASPRWFAYPYFEISVVIFISEHA